MVYPSFTKNSQSASFNPEPAAQFRLEKSSFTQVHFKNYFNVVLFNLVSMAPRANSTSENQKDWHHLVKYTHNWLNTQQTIHKQNITTAMSLTRFWSGRPSSLSPSNGGTYVRHNPGNSDGNPVTPPAVSDMPRQQPGRFSSIFMETTCQKNSEGQRQFYHKSRI